jgi:hypothetical protein
VKQKPAIGLVREAVAAVSANSPGDVSEYGRLLVNVATQVAEASKEGGFLGVGGTRVSESEQKNDRRNSRAGWPRRGRIVRNFIRDTSQFRSGVRRASACHALLRTRVTSAVTQDADQSDRK